MHNRRQYGDSPVSRSTSTASTADYRIIRSTSLRWSVRRPSAALVVYSYVRRRRR